MNNKELPAGCIGHRSDFLLEDGTADYEALAGKFIDGETNLVFNSNEELIAFLHPVVEEEVTEPQE